MPKRIFLDTENTEIPRRVTEMGMREMSYQVHKNRSYLAAHFRGGASRFRAFRVQSTVGGVAWLI